MTEQIEELLELENHGWRSLCDGTGSDFYGALMTEDGAMLLASGLSMDRSEVIASLAGAPPWERYEVDEPRLLALADGASTLLYTGRAFRAGAEPFVALMASTYVRRAGAWRLALYQQTPVDAGQSSS
ncbi:nuclear transport factor 2 family protein [Microbacterium murale]|uniref:DUF4440 domain-containing protein n=1 Tax=Microbacterium murale TaxID=1081040 RepID=A0ABU0P952_9MICO|nr:nuclear transport factor 2 family protein [Microbacterium murale]MDQ0643870.1 hypothetical protein [Microbacterium murale]